jgi:hypothetical protein
MDVRNTYRILIGKPERKRTGVGGGKDVDRIIINRR